MNLTRWLQLQQQVCLSHHGGAVSQLCHFQLTSSTTDMDALPALLSARYWYCLTIHWQCASGFVSVGGKKCGLARRFGEKLVNIFVQDCISVPV